MDTRTRLMLLTCGATSLALLTAWEFGIEPALFADWDQPSTVRWRFVLVGAGAAVAALLVSLLLLVRSDRRRAAAEQELRDLCASLDAKVRERTREHEALAERLRLETDRHRQAAELLRDVTENMREVFWEVAPDGERVLYISPAFRDLWGHDPDAVYDRIDAWTDIVLPEDRPRLPSPEARRLGPVEAQYRISRGDGTVRWVRDRSTPVPGVGGETQRIVGIAEDITHLEDLRERLLHAHRLQAVGTLAGGVAHDFNNLLATIMASAETVQLRTPPGDPRAAALARIIRACESGAGVVRNLLRVARQERLEAEPLGLPALITETARMARATFDRRARLKVAVPADLWPVRGDAVQIPQMLLNLLLNARDAVLEKGGGTVRVSARNVAAAQAPFADPDDSTERYVCIAIADDGCGMTQDVAEQAFNPFFTTKDGGRGTGLGLATVDGIVNAHGGHIDVDTRVGQGTTIQVWLPALPALPGTAEPATAPDAPAPAAAASATILLTEDEHDLRALIADHLTVQGHTVLAASDGTETLSRLSSDGPHIDLLILDLILPGVSGWTVLDQVMKSYPGLCIVIISGYAEAWEISKTASVGNVAMLEKPFTLARLDAVVNRALAGSRKTAAGGGA